MQDERSPARVFEPQAERMKAHAPEWIHRAAVCAIADDRVTELGEVHAYLILPPRLQRNLEGG